MADYSAYLVQVWHPTDDQRLRIVVQDAHSEKRLVFADFAQLNDFITRHAIFSKNGMSTNESTKEIFS